MRPPARAQAAIEILDSVIASAAEGGAAADTLIQRYFASRRYAGAKDRAAVRELVYRAIRFTADRPPSGRSALLGMAADDPALLALFDGTTHAPAPPQVGEPRARPSLAPHWLAPQLRAAFGSRYGEELAALATRAPLDLRVNSGRATVHDVQAALGGHPIAGLPLGLRLDGSAPRLDQHPLFLAGGFEVQDAGSQLVTRLAEARPGETVIDLCAGAGGKTLALADAMADEGRLIATDTDRSRLQAMTPRLTRAGVTMVEQRLLNPGKETAALSDLAGAADLVVVDAPCSGTGTWRRNPELRWRLTARRLHRLCAIQARLITLAAQLVKPGGRVLFIVCSVLNEEGTDHLPLAANLGLTVDTSLTLSPATTATDGFFAARFRA